MPKPKCSRCREMSPTRVVIAGVVTWLHDLCANCPDWERWEAEFQVEHKRKLEGVLSA